MFEHKTKCLLSRRFQQNQSTKEYIELFSVTGSHWTAGLTDDKENDKHFENTNFEVTPVCSLLM